MRFQGDGDAGGGGVRRRRRQTSTASRRSRPSAKPDVTVARVSVRDAGMHLERVSGIKRRKMSPERSSSPHDEGVATPKMSVPASPVAGTPIREAKSPISLLLAVAQSQNRTGDDDLTSLSWLHEKDLLKGMNINPSPPNSANSTPLKNNSSSSSSISDQFPTSDYVDESSASSSSVNSPTPYHSSASAQRSKHPHNIPYDPLVHTNNKPPYSFSCLIFMAIEDSPQKALPVKEIYAWILDHFPYFKNAPTGWKNSVRHNLSLNKCFQKVEKAPNIGKGSLWTVDQQYKPNLIQALTRSPFHPCSTIDPSSYFNNNNNNNNNNNTKNQATVDKSPISRLPNPELYPYLSRKLASAEMNTRHIKSEVTSDESLDAVDAAAVMLSLRNGIRYKLRQQEKGINCQVITTSPSQDHTYSAADSVDPLAVDEAFESDDDRVSKSSSRRKLEFEDEEARKIKEGAETLLNLAGITIRKRQNSSQSSEYGPKRTKQSPRRQYEDEASEERPAPFKPRLLRAKKKEAAKTAAATANNDEWVRHRRELENDRKVR